MPIKGNEESYDRKQLCISVVIGLALSLIMMRAGKVIQLEWSFLMLVLVSLIANRISPKFTCLAYVMAIVFVIDWILIRLGIKATFFKLSYAKMIYLVGILHFIEGIFTFLWGGQNSNPIMTYRGKEVAGGYEAHGQWLIPLLFFSIGGLYVPIIASVVYCNQSFVLSPKEKAKTMGGLIGGYGILLLAISYLVEEGLISLTIGVLSMPLLHEFLFMIDDYIETRPFKYPLPKKGIRVIEIMGTNKLGIARGDIIKAINEVIINDEVDYCRGLKQQENVRITIEKLTGEEVKLVCTVKELRESKLIFLPPY